MSETEYRFIQVRKEDLELLNIAKVIGVTKSIEILNNYESGVLLSTELNAIRSIVESNKLKINTLEKKLQTREIDSLDMVSRYLDGCSDKQLAFFKILSGHDKIIIEDLLDLMRTMLNMPDFNGVSLGGVIGGTTVGLKNMGLERLHTDKWENIDGEWFRYYWLKPEYKKNVVEWFKKQ